MSHEATGAQSQIAVTIERVSFVPLPLSFLFAPAFAFPFAPLPYFFQSTSFSFFFAPLNFRRMRLIAYLSMAAEETACKLKSTVVSTAQHSSHYCKQDGPGSSLE